MMRLFREGFRIFRLFGADRYFLGAYMADKVRKSISLGASLTRVGTVRFEEGWY